MPRNRSNSSPCRPDACSRRAINAAASFMCPAPTMFAICASSWAVTSLNDPTAPAPPVKPRTKSFQNPSGTAFRARFPNRSIASAPVMVVSFARSHADMNNSPAAPASRPPTAISRSDWYSCSALTSAVNIAPAASSIDTAIAPTAATTPRRPTTPTCAHAARAATPAAAADAASPRYDSDSADETAPDAIISARAAASPPCSAENAPLRADVTCSARKAPTSSIADARAFKNPDPSSSTDAAVTAAPAPIVWIG